MPEPRARIDRETSSVQRKPRRALLVVNPRSRSGRLAAGEAVTWLRAAGVELVDGTCDGAADVSPRILAHRGTVDCVILAGGDGTINAAGPALLATGLPLGVLPLGTANDFARSIDVPTDLGAAIGIIVGGLTHKVDVGEVNGRPFFNVASIGLAADLAKTLTTARKRRFGRLSYALTAGNVLVRATPFHATLLTDERTITVRTLQIAVGNGRFYGGGNVVAPQARIDGGTLDLYSLEFRQVWHMALMIPSFHNGGHGAMRDVRTARGARFVVVTRRSRAVNADGELVTQTPVTFTQKPAAVSVYVPDTCRLLKGSL